MIDLGFVVDWTKIKTFVDVVYVDKDDDDFTYWYSQDSIIAESMKYTESASDTDTIQFGISDTPCLEIDLIEMKDRFGNMIDLTNKDIDVGIYLGPFGDEFPYFEYIPLGTFKVSKHSKNYNSDITHVLAYSSALIDLDAEDITSDFFVHNLATSLNKYAFWSGNIERYLDKFTNNAFSEYYEITDPVQYNKALGDNYSYTSKGHGQANNYWTRVDVVVQECDYVRSFNNDDYYYYRVRATDDFSFISRNNSQAISDYLNDRNNLPSEYPRLDNSLDFSERGNFYASKSYIEGATIDVYRYYNDGNESKLIVPSVAQNLAAGHILQYSLHTGIGTYSDGRYIEPTNWTLRSTRSYSAIQLSDFLNVSCQTIKIKKFLFGVNLPLITGLNVNTVYNAMAVNYPVNSDGFTKSVMWDMLAECLGKMCRVNRNDGNFELYSLIDSDGLYPSNDIYPAQDIYPRKSNSYDIKLNMYEYLNYQGERSRKIGKVTVGTNGQYSAQVEDYNPNEYEEVTISPENIFIKGFEAVYGATSDELKGFADAILDNYKNYEFIPYECQSVGLPFMQAGDFIVVENIDHEQKKFYIARRTLSGIAALKDDFSAGGLS